MDDVAVVDQMLAFLYQRGRQDGVHRAGNVLAAHECCTSGGAARGTPDADAARGGSQEGAWDHDANEGATGVDAGAVGIVA